MPKPTVQNECCEMLPDASLDYSKVDTLQISSAMSRPEEAPAQVLATTASDACADAASMLTPDEALHSIHEEPDEGASSSGAEALRSASGRPSAACPEDLQHDSSRGPSFMQPTLGIDRQSAQPFPPSGALYKSTQTSLPSCLVCSGLTPVHAQRQLAASPKLLRPEAWH